MATRPVVFLVCLLLVACGGGTEPMGSAGGAGTGGTNANGAGSGAGGGTASGTGSGGAGGGTTMEACVGNFSIAQWFYTGSIAAGPCDTKPPKNCSTGTYLTFSDGACVCAAECTKEGISCDAAGKTVCQNSRNTSGSNHLKICVFPEWNLCKYVPPSGSGAGGGSAGSGGGSSSVRRAAGWPLSGTTRRRRRTHRRRRQVLAWVSP